MRARVLIVDDHEIVREGIRTLLSKARSDWEMVGEAGNAEQAMEAVGRLNPDLVVLHITMPGTSGLEVAPKIRKIKPRVPNSNVHDARIQPA
jgi:YesN/AraC family two-component response regulator